MGARKGDSAFRFPVNVKLDKVQMDYLLNGVREHRWDTIASGLRMALNEKMNGELRA